MKASDIMTSPVISVAPHAPVREVAGLLSEWRISAVPVLEDERLVGLVSEADVIRRRQFGADACRARDIMTHEVTTIAPDTPVSSIAALLEERGIRRVPVVEGGRVVGIVSRANLVQALAVQGAPGTTRTQDDEAVRRELLLRLEDKPWWRRGESNVVVEDGVAHFWGKLGGKIGAEEERAAARAAAEGIRGVRRIEDHRLQPRKLAAPGAAHIRRASERGHSRHGGVDSYHSFSFGNFFDSAYMGYGPLRAINEKVVQASIGATTYGLRDIEVIDYVLDGALAHENSLDHSVVLSSGGVQCLSAGSGVRFSETNGDSSRTSHFLQIWIESASHGQRAAFAHNQFSAESRRGRLRPIVSPDAREGSLRLRQDAVLYAGLFDGAEHARLDVAPERLVYVHVARGAIAVQGQELGAGDALAMPGATVSLERGRGAEVLVFDLPDATSRS